MMPWLLVLEGLVCVQHLVSRMKVLRQLVSQSYFLQGLTLLQHRYAFRTTKLLIISCTFDSKFFVSEIHGKVCVLLVYSIALQWSGVVLTRKDCYKLYSLCTSHCYNYYVWQYGSKAFSLKSFLFGYSSFLRCHIEITLKYQMEDKYCTTWSAVLLSIWHLVNSLTLYSGPLLKIRVPKLTDAIWIFLFFITSSVNNLFIISYFFYLQSNKTVSFFVINF